MKVTNRFNLPQPIVNALLKDEYSRGASTRSVTTLIDSPRLRILRAEHEGSLEEDVSDRLWSVLGSAMHKVFEEASGDLANHISEERLFLEHSGWTVSGAIDLQEILPTGAIALTDFKMASVWSVTFGLKEDWVAQLNAYAWLVRHSKGMRVERAQIVAVLRDWKARDASFKHDYPQSPITVVDIPLWSDAQQDAYMAERIRLHQAAEFERLTGGELPPCSGKERWERPAQYAVMKTGNKRAIRVLDSMAAAREYIHDKELSDKHYVELRPGANVRCEDWCEVSAHCSQWARIKQVTELEV